LRRSRWTGDGSWSGGGWSPSGVGLSGLPKQVVAASLRSELLGAVVAVRSPKRSLHSCLAVVVEY
jgi:hypothetical protein